MLAVTVLLSTAFALGCGKPAPPKKASKSKKVKDLIYRLGDKDKAKRKKAEDGLVKIGKAAVEPLIAALSGQARKTVGVGLMGATQGAAVTLLKGDDSIKAHAAKALGRIGDERAVKPLIAALKDEDAKNAAAGALKTLTKQDFGDDQKKWAEWLATEKG
jgi:HEAT repeat protein